MDGKGDEPYDHADPRSKARLLLVDGGPQAVSAVAAMLLAIAVLATGGQLTVGTSALDIFGGLIIECVGIMLMFVGLAIGGGRTHSKPLFVGSVLLAGIPSTALLSQMLLGLRAYALPMPTPRFIILTDGDAVKKSCYQQETC